MRLSHDHAPAQHLWQTVLVVVLLIMSLLYVPPSSPTSQTVSTIFDPSSLSLSFVPNMGQTDSAVRFQAHGAGSVLFFTPQEVVVATIKRALTQVNAQLNRTVYPALSAQIQHL